MNKKNFLSSRLPRFYDFPRKERTQIIANFYGFGPEEINNLENFASLEENLTDTFVENAIGTFSLPLGVATNFLINQENILVPMAVEETSIIAAASYGAKLIRSAGGFLAESSKPIMTGQVQFYLPPGIEWEKILAEKKDTLILHANQGQERLIQRGGGVEDISWYQIKKLNCIVLLVQIHTCDAMGANIVNTICEKICNKINEIFPNVRNGFRILTNLTTERTAQASCILPPKVFSNDKVKANEIITAIYQGWEFANNDIRRAATHNKGVMNGIDPIVIATGNDWRAVEAGAHAYAAQYGTYRPLTDWWIDSFGNLCGRLKIPMAIGVVGGVTKLHPTVKIALKILGNPNAQKLSQIIVSVGLAQNLSALKALALEGIQKGHMSLHQRNLKILEEQQTNNHFQISAG